MAQFSDLPNELVTQIWWGVWAPADITNFALVSRKISEAGYWHLKNHQTLMKKYSTLSNVIYSRDLKPLGHEDSLSFLLSDILSDPFIGLYVRTLWVDIPEKPGTRTKDMVSYFVSVKTDLALVERALARLIQPKKLVQWMTMLQDGDEAPLLFLIILLCPNLHSLNLQGNEPMFFAFRGFLKLVSEDIKVSNDFFRNLERVELGCWGVDNAGMDCVELLTTLPSLKSIDATSIRVGTCFVNNSLVPKSSNVETLTFQVSRINNPCLGRLFQVFKCLKSFGYIFSSDRQFAPADMCTNLLQYTGHSLETLTLSNQYPVGGREERANLASLCGFTALKNLVVDLELFLKQRQPEPLTVAMDLPSSIKKMTIHCADLINLKLLSTIILDMVVAKVEMLLDMSFLELYISGLPDKSLEWNLDSFWEQCQNAGFTLLVSEEEPDGLPIYESRF